MNTAYLRLSRPNLTNCYLGIDPGAKGAICVLPKDQGEAPLCFPFKDTTSTNREIFSFLYYLCSSPRNIVSIGIEHNTGYAGKISMGARMFSFGVQTGRIYGILETLKNLKLLKQSYLNIIPTVWQRGLLIPPKAKMGRKVVESSNQWKKRLFQFAAKLFPNGENLDVDTADSFLIAEYIRRKEENLL